MWSGRYSRTCCFILIWTIGFWIEASVVAENPRSLETTIRYGKQTFSQVCGPRRRKRLVDIHDVAMVCDSPYAKEGDDNEGDDDDGDDGYVNKLSCGKGDTAKVSITFWASKKAVDVDVALDISAIFLGQAHQVVNRTSICDFQGLEYLNARTGEDTYVCPLEQGTYDLSTEFTVPQFDWNKKAGFLPDLRVSFYSSVESVDEPLVGCFETGTTAELSKEKDIQRRGEKYLLGSITLLFFVLAFFIIGQNRRKRQAERAYKRQQATMKRRFHYIRTNQVGEVAAPGRAAQTPDGTGREPSLRVLT